LSLDAFQFSIKLVWPTFAAARPVGVVGGFVSGQAVVVTRAPVFPEWLPAASYASIARLYEVLQARPEKIPVVTELVPTSVPSR
jgi:hypothetical protein